MGSPAPAGPEAFERLARALAAAPTEPEVVLGLAVAELRHGLGLARADRVLPGELPAGHPLVERAIDERRAVADGGKVAVPLVLGDCCLGVLIGDRAGRPLELGEADLGRLGALAAVAAAFLDRAVAARRLERSLAARTEFVSLASHELRTPIAVVHGIVATLHLRGDRLRPGQVRELCATAFEHTSKLAVLTNQLLDLSRLEAGAATAHPERFRLRELVETVVARAAADRRHDVQVDVDPEVELVSDADALDHVLSNLVVNALHYGEPPVRVRAGGREVVVEDVGAGVPTDLVARLFDRFTRGRPDVAGSGLGLAIARSYAELVGAELDYEPVEPRGARFRLTLPESASGAAVTPG